MSGRLLEVAAGAAGGRRDQAGFETRAGFAGQILCSHTDPSLRWLPFLRMRSLHLGQVPMLVSLARDRESADGDSGLYTTRQGG